MTSIKPFQIEDLFEINPVNLDPLTENFNLQFYFQYLIEWPSLFFKSVEVSNDFNQDHEISGYMMGKNARKIVEERMAYPHNCSHSQCSIQKNRISIGFMFAFGKLGKGLELYETLFIDLFVKVTNVLAQHLYEKLDYSVYRRVVGYYGRDPPTDKNATDDEIDAFDMRKLLPVVMLRTKL